MAIGDVETLRFPMTMSKSTDDGTTSVIEAAAVYTPTTHDIVGTQFVISNVTKEGLTEGTMIIIAIKKT